MGSSEIARKQRYLAQMTSNKSLSQSQFSTACVPRAERLSPEGAGASGASKSFMHKSERPVSPDVARLCEECIARVFFFKEEAQRVLTDEHFSPSDPKLSILLYESLRVPAWIGLVGCCEVCFTHLSQLKREAIHMLLNQNRTIWSNSPSASISTSYNAFGSQTLPISSQSPSPNQQQKFSNPRTESWVREHSRVETLCCENYEMSSFTDTVSQQGKKKKTDDESTVLCHFSGPLPFSPSKVAAMLPAGTSAAFSYIARVVQKLHLTSRRRKRGSENNRYPTNFCGLLQKDPLPVPPNLLQTHSKGREVPETPKVRVILRLNPVLTADTSQSQALKVDLHKKQVTVLEPVTQNTQRSAAGSIFTPKTFTFDAIFGPESSQAKVCDKSLCAVLQSVVAGADGCILSFGQTKAGTSYTMFGGDDGAPNLGIIPCAISWLFKLIKKKKDKTWANISVSVSAVEVCGETEVIRDLLSGFEAGDHSHKPNVYLQEDPVCGIQLNNRKVVSAPSEERAGCLLDAALASRNTDMAGCKGTFHHPCHMFYTLHVCQKHIESSPTSGMHIEQSKLSLIDLGSCTRERAKNNTEVCLHDLGNVIVAKLNGHKHVLNNGSKLAMLLQESLGNINCHTTVVAHVSTSHDDLSESMCTIQIASCIRRLQRIRKQVCSSPGARSLGKEKKVKDAPKLRAFCYTGSLDHNVSLSHLFDDLEDHSESDKSCDTVFCMDPKGVLHDKEVRGNKKEFVPIIPSLQKNKADFKSSFSMKHCDILHLSPKQMQKLPAQQYSSAPDLECFKCNTFAELQNRLGFINEREMVGLHSCHLKIQPIEAVTKFELPSGKVVKLSAEKPDIQQFQCKKQANDHEQGQPTQGGNFKKDIKEIPCRFSGHNKKTQNLPPRSTRSQKASSSKQCERDNESQCLAKTKDTTPSMSCKVQVLSSKKSTLSPKIRVPPVGKSSSALTSAPGTPASFPITRCEVIPQFSTENQEEKATITVTVQQPLDLNGFDELIYSVVKEVEVSGAVKTGKAAKVANAAKLDSLKNLPLGSQPVNIIGSVGNEQIAADSVSEVQALGITDKTPSELSEGKTISMSQNYVVNLKTDNNVTQLDVNSKESKTVTGMTKTDSGSTFQDGTSRFGQEACEMASEQEDTKRKCEQLYGEIKDNVSLANQSISEDFQMNPAENLFSNYLGNDTSSLTWAFLDTDKRDSLYPHTSVKNTSSNSPKATLEKEVNKSSLVEWAKYSKSMPLVPRSDNNSPNKKDRKFLQPTLTQTTSDNQLKTTNLKSPTDESTKLFSAKLKQLTNRSRSLSRPNVQCVAVQPFQQIDNVFTQGSVGKWTSPKVNKHIEKVNQQELGAKGRLEGQFMSANAKSTAGLSYFESDFLTLSQGNHSLRIVPRVFPLYDVDELDDTQPSKHSQSNMSGINQVFSSPVVNKLSGTVPNSPNSNKCSINRSSSLSPDGFSRKQISWSSQSLSRKQTKAPISSKYPNKILNGRVEVLRASEDSLSSSSQGSSEIDDLEESKRKIKLLSHNLPSPYSRNTAPRKPNHCSGHASDNTSVLSGELPPAMYKTALLYNRNSMVSSGYESLKRDSETTYSSTSIHDSISDQSCFYSTLKSARSSKKRNNSGSHQRYPSQDTISSLRRSLSGSKIRWVDRGASDAYEIKVYEIDNVANLQRRGKAENKNVVCFSAKLKFLEHRQQRIAEMRAKYNTLKRELEVAKQHLMMDPQKWTHEFDLWQTFEVDSLEHLEALELVTQRLECQVFRCKAHVMMVTSFDASPKRRYNKKYWPPNDYKGFIGI